jgi:hypothetical protein
LKRSKNGNFILRILTPNDNCPKESFAESSSKSKLVFDSRHCRFIGANGPSICWNMLCRRRMQTTTCNEMQLIIIWVADTKNSIINLTGKWRLRSERSKFTVIQHYPTLSNFIQVYPNCGFDTYDRIQCRHHRFFARKQNSATASRMNK